MDVCSICREKYMLHSVATLTCGHEFCKDCITRWFKEDISCPECRSLQNPSRILSGDFKPTRASALRALQKIKKL